MPRQVGNQAAFVFAVRHGAGNQQLQVFGVHRSGNYVRCNKRSALHRMLRPLTAQCPLVIASYAS
jgi:hypothetical protein